MTRKRAPSSHSTQNQYVAGGSSRVAIFWFASKPEWVPLPNAAISAPRGLSALRTKLAAIAAEPPNHAVHQPIVGGAVDLGDRNSVLDARVK